MAEIPFIPEVGPNGAVLNAPRVIEDRRQGLARGFSVIRTEEGAPFFVLSCMVAAKLVTGVRFDRLRPDDRDSWLLSLGFMAGIAVMLFARRTVRWRHVMDGKGAPAPHVRFALDGLYILQLLLGLSALASLAAASRLHAQLLPLLPLVVAMMAVAVSRTWAARLVRHGVRLPDSFVLSRLDGKIDE